MLMALLSMHRVYDTSFDRERRSAVGNDIPIHAVLFSRQVVALGCRADAQFVMYEDWDFWLQVSSYTPFLHVPGRQRLIARAHPTNQVRSRLKKH